MDLEDFLLAGEEISARYENLLATNKRVIRTAKNSDGGEKFADIPYKHISSVELKKSDPPRWLAILGFLALLLGAVIYTETEAGVIGVLIGMVLILIGLLASGKGEIQFYAPGLDNSARERWKTEGDERGAVEFLRIVRKNTGYVKEN